MPAISVIIPVYNVSNYVETCLESVTNQTFQDFELIIVEDCSTDDSLEIVEAWVANQCSKRITLLKQRFNKGLSAARNLGLTYAKGRYITFLDSDDYFSTDYLEVLYKSIETEIAEIVAVNNTTFYQKGLSKRLTIATSYWGRTPLVLHGKQILEHFVLTKIPSDQACAKLFSADFLREKKLRFKEGVYHEDVLFCIEAYSHARKLVQLPYAGYMRLIRAGSITNSISAKFIEDKFHILSEIKTLILTDSTGCLQTYYAESVISQGMAIFRKKGLSYAQFTRYVSMWLEAVSTISPQYLSGSGYIVLRILALPSYFAFALYKSGVINFINRVRLRIKRARLEASNKQTPANS